LKWGVWGRERKVLGTRRELIGGNIQVAGALDSLGTS